MPSDIIVALDIPVYKIWFVCNYKAHQPNTVLLDNALATTGAGVPAAIVAQLVHLDRKILEICGDDGFTINSQELKTAVQLSLQLATLILRDKAYGTIQWKQANMGSPNFGVEYDNSDFVKYAKRSGAHGHRLTSADQLLDILKTCPDSLGVHGIEAPVDYSENDRILNHDIQELSQEV